MNLLLYNLVTDADDPILGFTTSWIRVLAERMEQIQVVTMRSGRIEVPANVEVHSVGKERGFSEPRRAVEFYRLLVRLVRREHFQVCFSHMMPLFTVMGAPVLRAYGIPTVTWYTHPSLTPTLKLAHRLSHTMVTSLPGSYPYRRDKLKVIGHGVDTDLFRPGESEERHPRPLILCVGRLSPVKDHPTLLRAVHRLCQWGDEVETVILGSPAKPEDVSYERSLRRLAEELEIDHLVRFESGVPPLELPARYRQAWAHVNLTPAGFGDKVAWEAMACGTLSLVANPDFRETLGHHAGLLLFDIGDPEDLAKKLQAVLEMDERERAGIGFSLRERVVRHHSLQRLADRLEEILVEAI